MGEGGWTTTGAGRDTLGLDWVTTRGRPSGAGSGVGTARVTGTGSGVGCPLAAGTSTPARKTSAVYRTTPRSRSNDPSDAGIEASLVPFVA